MAQHKGSKPKRPFDNQLGFWAVCGGFNKFATISTYASQASYSSNWVNAHSECMFFISSASADPYANEMDNTSLSGGQSGPSPVFMEWIDDAHATFGRRSIDEFF